VGEQDVADRLVGHLADPGYEVAGHPGRRAGVDHLAGYPDRVNVIASDVARAMIVERGQQDMESEIQRFPRLFTPSTRTAW
jgi:hypothetical protein